MNSYYNKFLENLDNFKKKKILNKKPIKIRIK